MRVVRFVLWCAVAAGVWSHGVWTGARIAPVLLRQRAEKAAAARAPELHEIEF